MAEPRDLSVVLARLAVIGQAHADGIGPADVEGTCQFCGLDVSADSSAESAHEIWCAWIAGRKLSSSDITAVQRLARVLAYRVD